MFYIQSHWVKYKGYTWLHSHKPKIYISFKLKICSLLGYRGRAEIRYYIQGCRTCKDFLALPEDQIKFFVPCKCIIFQFVTVTSDFFRIVLVLNGNTLFEGVWDLHIFTNLFRFHRNTVFTLF